MKALILTALFVTCGLVAAVAAQRPKPAFTVGEQDEIREAVFRYQFEHNASGQQQNAKIYFLSLGKDKDPTDAFIARFKDHQPRVKKQSQSTGNFEVLDKETKERGLIFIVHTIKRVNRNKVLVGGGYYEAGLSSSGNTYTLVRRGRKWVVIRDQMLWIS